MRLLTALLAGVLLSSACASPSPKLPPRQLALELEADTTALVHSVSPLGLPDPAARSSMYCSGVFVGPTVILTAQHCVAELGASPERIILHLLGLDDDAPPTNPIGAEAHFATEDDYKRGSYWTGTVIGSDINVDLGAIRIDGPAPKHTWARLSTGDIYAGDRVELVGHVGGYTWSYAEGVISSVRMAEPNGHGRAMQTIQVAAPVGHGDSGGGIFDASGNLIGIFSYIDSGAPGMGFAVHRDAIRAFLVKLPR